MTHLVDINDIIGCPLGTDTTFQFFTKDFKYQNGETVFIQNNDEKFEIETYVYCQIDVPFKKEYKLITLNKKQNA